jgi:hypothetical protein
MAQNIRRIISTPISIRQVCLGMSLKSMNGPFGAFSSSASTNNLDAPSNNTGGGHAISLPPTRSTSPTQFNFKREYCQLTQFGCSIKASASTGDFEVGSVAESVAEMTWTLRQLPMDLSMRQRLKL